MSAARIGRVLAIAGSDSGGGAGVQADIKTITMLGGHAMTAVTAITAQNTLGVAQVLAVPAAMVLAQIEAVATDIGVDAIKIGMVGDAATAEALAYFLTPSPLVGEGRGEGTNQVSSAAAPAASADPSLNPLPQGERAVRAVVFDPVMVASSGAALADTATIAAFGRLMDVAFLVTPNLPELAGLTDMAVVDEASMAAAAQVLVARHGTAVLAKGGHLPGGMVTDLLVTAEGIALRWSEPRIDTRHSHGTGCTLSSAIATGLAQGMPLVEAIGRARAYVRAALLAAPGLGQGHGPMGHGLGRSHFGG